MKEIKTFTTLLKMVKENLEKNNNREILIGVEKIFPSVHIIFK